MMTEGVNRTQRNGGFVYREPSHRQPGRRAPRRERAFTLIELMIVVAVIGILAAIALPAYQDYTVRSKVSEGLLFASAAKIAVVETFAFTGALPSSNEAARLTEASNINGKYVAQTEVQNEGEIWVRFNDRVPQLNGRHVVLAAQVQGGAINWCCSSPDLEARYLPATCRDSSCGTSSTPQLPTPPHTPSPPPE
ncbi:pilin, partial [Thiocapsa imhoffii]|uniref:pilin n=1 Tax=Thiocapsa imhoffii TaxID=382777 RepID=UPI0023EF3C7A